MNIPFTGSGKMGGWTSLSNTERWPPYLFRAAVLSLLALSYGVLTQKYRAYDIDNPWFLSFSYNACHEGIVVDDFLQRRFPAGMDGIHLFGKVAAGLQCFIMDRAGWSPTTVVALNATFTIVSFCFLWSFLRRLGYRETWIAAFLLLLGMTEPVVSMVEKARYEFFAFFLLCLALWLGVMGLELLSLVTAFCAVETEPAAVMVPIAVALLLASRTKNLRLIAVKCVIAVLTAVVFYVMLHPSAIQQMAASSSAMAERFPLGGTLRAYFLERRRHWPESAVLLLGAYLYWRGRNKIADRTPLWIALLMSVILFLLHPTAAYVVFAMPFLLWPTLQAYVRSGACKWTLAVLFAYLVAGYGYLYVVNLHEGFDKDDFNLVRRRLNEAGDTLAISQEKLRVVGDYSLWFTHPRHYRALTNSTTLQDADIFLCFDGPLEKGGLSASTSTWCAAGRQLAPMREISSVELKGHLLHLYSLVR